MQDFLFLKINGDNIRVDYSDIVYIECVKNHVKVVTTTTFHFVLVTMKYVEDNLPTNRFCRIHRSYIVALKHIDRFNNKSVTISGKRFPIGVEHRDVLTERVVVLGPNPRSSVACLGN